MNTDVQTPIALTIAGSDSGGGAGIQADLKAFSALGVYGASVLTALTAQNTVGVSAIHAVDPGFIRQQIDAVFDDIAVDAVKIGMLGTPAVIDTVRQGLVAHRPRWVVLDPVMVAKSGDALLAEEAVAALRDDLVPLAHMITPNLPEAARLLSRAEIGEKDEMPAVAEALLALGPKAVLLKGGHLTGAESADLFLDSNGIREWLPGKRVATKNTHGTGCTLSSAIAAGLAKGLDLLAATQAAKRYIADAIAAADELRVGQGHGPVHHFHALWPR